MAPSCITRSMTASTAPIRAAATGCFASAAASAVGAIARRAQQTIDTMTPKVLDGKKHRPSSEFDSEGML
jgi:hypothetical protein